MLEEVFDVSQKNCEGIIMKGKTKDIKTRKEDADFLNDQKGARVQKMLGREKKIVSFLEKQVGLIVLFRLMCLIISFNNKVF